jgi:hypothetical protein
MLYVSIDKFLTKKIRVLRKKSNFKWTAKKLSIKDFKEGKLAEHTVSANISHCPKEEPSLNSIFSRQHLKINQKFKIHFKYC